METVTPTLIVSALLAVVFACLFARIDPDRTPYEARLGIALGFHISATVAGAILAFRFSAWATAAGLGVPS